MSTEIHRSGHARLADQVRTGAGVACALVGSRATGKTTALQHLADAAGDLHALWLSGSPDETSQPFALLRQLPDVPDADDPAEVRRAFWRFLHTRRPALLLVDDAHWADPESARVLAHVARRVRGRPLGMVLAADADRPLHDELARLPRIELPPVDARSARELLSDVDAPDHVLSEMARRCDGNPLVLREFAATLTADQLAGRDPLPRRVLLGRRSLEVFSRPWARLPEPTRTWLLVLALGPDSFAVCLRAARSLGLCLDELAPAEQAGVVHAADVPRWSSPLVRAAVRQSATRAATARVCAALAEAADEADWPVEHARYLAGALTDPDRAAAALAAATVPMAHAGQLLEAREAAVHAAALTTDHAERERYRIIAAELAWLAGYSDHALDLLEQAAPQRSPDASTSASIIRAVIHGFRESWTSGWRLLPTGTDLEPGSAEHALRLLVTVLTAGWENATTGSLQDTVARLRGAVEPRLEPVPGVVGALQRIAAGRSDPDPDQREALRSLAWWAKPSDALHPKAWPPPLLPVFIGEEDRYAQLFATLLRGEAVQAAPSTRALLLHKLATAQLALGHWDHALANAGQGARLADELGHHALHSELLLTSAWIAAARGDEQACSRCVDAAARHAGRRSAGRQPPTMQWVRGLAALSGGRPAEAFDRLRALHHSDDSLHHAVLRRLSTVDAVEAAVQANRRAEAESLVADFARWVDAGAARWAHLDLARCRALLDGDDTEQQHREALVLSAETGRLMSSARTELQFGAWLRRRRRHQEAREHLRMAEEHFQRLGAETWRMRAHAELRATGETHNPRPQDDLTPQEHQIALLAAEGLSNRQIAERLSLSPRTVGYHLYKVFPKLDITSRTQLAAVLGHPAR